MLAGYPCQPFSSAGKRKGEDDPRHLWPHIADGIVASRPSAVFFENVQGHVTLGLRDVLHDLGRMGYRTTWGLFSAAEVGAPHQRKRVYILGWLPDSNGRRLMDAVQRSQYEAGMGTRESAGSRNSQLADTTGKRDREYQQGIPITDECISRGEEGATNVGGRLQEELADTTCKRRSGCKQHKNRATERAASREGSGKLANTNNCRSRKNIQPSKLWAGGTKQPSRNCGRTKPAQAAERWPARPGQKQHTWEEPRTVANTKGRGNRRKS